MPYLQAPQAGAAQLGAAQLGAAAQHLAGFAFGHFGARVLQHLAAEASPATRAKAAIAQTANMTLRTISNSSLDLGTSIVCRAAPRRQHSRQLPLVRTGVYVDISSESTVKVAVERNLSNESTLPNLQFGKSGWT